MTLYIIGIGLEKEDISLKELERIKSSKEVYLENYTSILPEKEELERLYKKKIILADRDLVESNFSEIIKKAKKENISILIPGDVFSATTHISIFHEAKKNKIDVEVINNASILTAVGITGLELYKFGRVASIPFENSKVKIPVKILKENLKINLHTLFLLDIDNKTKGYLTVKEAIEYLLRNNVDNKIKAVGCARLGCSDYKLKSGTLEELRGLDFGKPPYCLIIPAKKLHFMEEEMLQLWNSQ